MVTCRTLIAAVDAVVIPLLGCGAWAGDPGERGNIAAMMEKLPAFSEQVAQPVETDWLVAPTERRTSVYRGEHAHEIVMANGLISRAWRLLPNAATVAYDNLMTDKAMLRGVKPEMMVQLNGENLEVGGLRGQPDYAYLRPEWVDSMTNDPGAFQFVGFEVGKTQARFPWKRKRYSANLPWPPLGASLTLHFQPPSGKHQGLMVSVHYEMYDGIPLMSKWFTIRNGGSQPVTLTRFTSEILAVLEDYPYDSGQTPNLHVESDYAFGGDSARGADKTTHWVRDPQYTNIRNSPLAMLESGPPMGPDAVIEPDQTFESFRMYELIHDSTERERKGLALRRMYRTIAPWVTENPIGFYVCGLDPATVRLAIDQCAELGFEMLGLSFGSGLNVEDVAPNYMAQIKELADYAHSKNIGLGGYWLTGEGFQRLSAKSEHDCIDPKTGKPGGGGYGQPCLCSQYGENCLRDLRTFIEQTGLDLFENDGSYPGSVCASTKHPGHRGLNDSQWMMWKKMTDLYKWCLARGVYLHVPDWYFLSGASKIFFGYREENWMLPRDRQIILARQNIYDGTWDKTASMGWMFLALVSYKGGKAEATIEPLHEHLDTYGWHLAQNLGSGVQCYYRGARLYDTDETKALVRKWVDFYKEYREILDSDIIHVRRPDGRDIDCMLHVNPLLKQKGLAMVYNPLDRKIVRTLRLPLYYTGLTNTASIREQEGRPRSYKLDRACNVQLPIEMGPNSLTWFVIEGGAEETTMRVPRSPTLTKEISAVRYAPPGWYMKDHCLFFREGLWHLFAPLGRIGHSWEDPGSEETAEHMISPDLVNWEHLGTAVAASGKQDHFDKMMGGIAPHVIEHDGKFQMYYSGWTFPSKRPKFDLAGYRQSIGLATSSDLCQWKKPEEFAKTGLGVQGTDQCIVRDEANDRWLMYTWTGQIPVYKSSDLLHWSQAGIALTEANLVGIGESPFVMKHPRSGKWIIFLNNGYSVSDDPLCFPHAKPYPFKCGWHGMPGVKPSGAWGDGTNALADDDGVGFAHEIIEFHGQWYMTGVVGRDGQFKLKFTPFEWTDDFIQLVNL